jgi:ectoine hydroxylase-related dioxygenase (phytanoyl-CoA dioxygenase family)
MTRQVLSPRQIADYQRDGYVVVPRFFSEAEITKLYAVALADDAMAKNAIDLNDQTGKKTRLTLWFSPGDDLYGFLTRSERMVHGAAQLLDSTAPVCHFHSKLMQKKPKVGGAWEWHQDYGYWYKDQFMFPDQMISIMVALSPANRENGCLQVIKGSHKLGRVNHGFAGEQVGADLTMVDNILKTNELFYCELQPGDALFFHSNLLHRSEANLSDQPRWSLISCYNSQSNPAYHEKSTSYQVPVDVVPDDALLNWQLGGATAANFLRKEDDPALRDTGWEIPVG